MASQLRLHFPIGFAGLLAVDSELPYGVPIADGGTIAAILFAATILILRVHSILTEGGDAWNSDEAAGFGARRATLPYALFEATFYS